MPADVRSGQAFSGPVAYVGDGDSLFVAVGPSHAQWAEARLADFCAPELHEPGGTEAKDTLSRLIEGKKVECIAEHRSYDPVVVVCWLRSVGDLMRSASVGEGERDVSFEVSTNLAEGSFSGRTSLRTTVSLRPNFRPAHRK